MKHSSDLSAARRAKELLQKKYQDAVWLRGIGIAPAESGFAIRLNVDPESGPDRSELPTEWAGVPVEVLMTGGYGPR